MKIILKIGMESISLQNPYKKTVLAISLTLSH